MRFSSASTNFTYLSTRPILLAKNQQIIFIRMNKRSLLLATIGLILGLAIFYSSPFEVASDHEEEIGNEERPDAPVLEGEELEKFKKYVAERLQSNSLKSSSVSGESTYANGRLSGTWNAKISHTGWYGYRVDNSAYDSLHNVFYVVTYAGHLYKLEYENEVKWTLLNHKIVMNPTNNGTANPVFSGTLLDNDVFRLIRSNDDLGRMEYSDDEGATWTAATGAGIAQSWSNQICEISYNGKKRIVLHTYNANYHHIYYSDDNGATYTASSLSFPISTYDMKIAKPFYTNEVYMWVWNKSSKKIDIYKYNNTNEDFELKTNSSSTLLGTNLSSAAATYYNGYYHFYLSTVNSEYTVYYSNDEGATWVEKNAGRDKPFEILCPDKPNMLISGFEDMKLTTDYGATWNGFGYKLGWDMQHMRTYEMSNGNHITLVGLDFGCYVSETPENKDSYTWCNNGAWYAMHYDAASSQNFNSIYMANQDRGATAYADTAIDVNTKDIDGTDVLRVCYSKRETSAWTWFYYGRIKHQYNFTTGKTGGSAVFDGLGNWWAAPIVASPDPTEDAIYAAYGSNLQKFTYDESSNTITQSAHAYDFNSKYKSEIGGFGYSELNRDLWYVALNNGTFVYSKDGGETWTRSKFYGQTPKANDQYYNYPKNQIVIRASQIDTNKVYFAGVGNYFLISEDNGNYFSSKINGLNISRIRDFALSPDEQFIFAACGYGGAWVYSAENEKWYQMNDDPIPSVDFTDVEFIKSQNCVRFGTFGSGIIEFKLNNHFYPVDGPKNLAGIINNDNNIQLNWEDQSDDEDGFYIEKAIEGNFYRVDTLDANATQFEEAISEYEETMYYRVKAFKNDTASFATNVVIINTPKQGYISPDNWEIIDFSSEETSSEYSPVIYAIDNDENTYWHTQYGAAQPAHPHYITLDLGEEKGLAGFRYLPRQDGMSVGNVADYAVYVSNDTNNWGDAVVSGKLNSGSTIKEVLFNAMVYGRYVKFEALSSTSGDNYTSIAEFILLYQMVPPDVPTSFDAMIFNETSILLRWQDGSLNTEGYIVEQLIDGEFVEIETVLLPNKYLMLNDQTPATTFQFRVKSFNEGGSSAYTDPLEATTGGTTNIKELKAELKTYPNPFSNQLSVEIPSFTQSAIIRIIDAQGKSVIEQQVELGTTVQRLNTSGISSGMYMIDLIFDDKHAVTKVIKK